MIHHAPCVITGYRFHQQDWCLRCTLTAITSGRIVRDAMRHDLAHFRDHRGFWMDYVEDRSRKPILAIFNTDTARCKACGVTLSDTLYHHTPHFDVPETNAIKPIRKRKS